MSALTSEIKLEKFTYGGDAMGRLPDPLTGTGGRAVFVPFGIPGELVRVRMVEEKRGFARAELLEVLEASPQRISPKCRHFGVCGGCHYQHLPYQAQLAAKTEVLRDQLQRIGKIEEPPVSPMVACPSPWNYRNHVGFQLTHAGKLGYVGSGSAGNDRSSPVQAVIPITECHLLDQPLDALWPGLEFEANMPIERVSIRSGVNGDLMLVLESGEFEVPEMELEAGISVVHLSAGDALVMAGEDHLIMQVLERPFHVSAGSFFQVNSGMAEKMVAHLLQVLPSPTGTILDVYCGVGLFSAFLAPGCKRLIGIEVSPSACDDFLLNLDEFDHVELYESTAELAISHLEGPVDVLLVDPPRAGLDKHVLDGILKLQPPTVVYISCDPATLARDAARLISGGYQLVDVTPFDMFPQTYHIESIALFKQ
jgi:23S rRNA (uracil1939-C5)-methyltransferase